MQQLEQTMRDEGALQARGLHTHLDPDLALTPDQAAGADRALRVG